MSIPPVHTKQAFISRTFPFQITWVSSRSEEILQMPSLLGLSSWILILSLSVFVLISILIIMTALFLIFTLILLHWYLYYIFSHPGWTWRVKQNILTFFCSIMSDEGIPGKTNFTALLHTEKVQKYSFSQQTGSNCWFLSDRKSNLIHQNKQGHWVNGREELIWALNLYLELNYLGDIWPWTH